MNADNLDGVLVIDKPEGLTSHDVVHRVRRVMGTRRVGHAGTLDPMATGVLLVLVGTATKLSRFLTLEFKCYEAEIMLGAATDTYDAAGNVVRRSPVPEAVLERLAHGPRASRDTDDCPIERALREERRRTEQVPPAFSAIKHNGMASYRRARKGEQVELPPRPVSVKSLTLVSSGLEPHPHLRVHMKVSKGYYVRSLAYDLGQRLGTDAHLTFLRRTAAGPFGLDEAIGLPTDRHQGLQALIPLSEVARRVMPTAQLTVRGACRAVQGKTLSEQDFSTALAEDPTRPSAWFAPDGRLVAVGNRSKGRPTVLRAMVDHTQVC